MKMTSKLLTLSASLVIMASVFVFISPVTIAANPDHYTTGYTPALSSGEPYAFVNKFCNESAPSVSRDFCLKVFKSDPRSAKAKKILDLLFVVLDAAVGNLRATNAYLSDRLKKAVEKALAAALEGCCKDYDSAVKELLMAPKELPDDPALVSYDVGVAYDSLDLCTYLLNEKKITDAAILSRHNVSFEYVKLAVDVAYLVN